MSTPSIEPGQDSPHFLLSVNIVPQYFVNNRHPPWEDLKLLYVRRYPTLNRSIYCGLDGSASIFSAVCDITITDPRGIRPQTFSNSSSLLNTRLGWLSRRAAGRIPSKAFHITNTFRDPPIDPDSADLVPLSHALRRSSVHNGRCALTRATSSPTLKGFVIVVRAQPQPADLVHLPFAGNHEDGDVFPRRIRRQISKPSVPGSMGSRMIKSTLPQRLLNPSPLTVSP